MPSFRLHIPKDRRICAIYQPTFGMVHTSCSDSSENLVTLCEAGLFPTPPFRIQPRIFTPSLDNKGRALIGYCCDNPDDQVMDPSSGLEPRCAKACNNIRKIKKQFINNE
ncbi:uncharacterized protein LOC121428506 [Lytechinus variegatus]|uniref:uncharacterized protein LOC121428506 n=1 Tax=Lytechinus variegatus TaxID=7654 RepID=UPI001BB20633|nr:uncharacterized protein LOC121428506 [Lytechinus variegatus]